VHRNAGVNLADQCGKAGELDENLVRLEIRDSATQTFNSGVELRTRHAVKEVGVNHGKSGGEISKIGLPLLCRQLWLTIDRPA
jgi:hypothetical protein